MNMKEKKIEQIEEIVQQALEKQSNPYELRREIHESIKDYMNSYEYGEKYYQLFQEAVARYEKDLML